MDRRELEVWLRGEYYYFTRELEPKLHHAYNKSIFLLEDYGFCYDSHEGCKSIVEPSGRYLLFNFIRECIKESGKYGDIIRLHNASEVEEFIEHLKKFVTNKRYSQKFDNVVEEYLYYESRRNPSSSRFTRDLLEKSKSPFILNTTPFIAGGRAQIAHDNIIHSDQHTVTISSMVTVLAMFTFISTVFYIMCSKFRSMHQNQQSLKRAKITEMNVVTEISKEKRF